MCYHLKKQNMGAAKALRPFHEAALALFAVGAPPPVVADKFDKYVSHGTIYRWYNDWCDLKGIPVENRYRARKKNEPRHIIASEIAHKELRRKKRLEREAKAKRADAQ